MSDAESYEAQGRAHAELKDARSKVATLRASLLAYSRRLEETSSFLKTFLADPLAVGHIPASEQVKSDYRNLSSSTFEKYVDDLVSEVKKVNQLQALVDNF